MKVKTFILTFLMMMSSPFLFGQHWVPDQLYYSGTMQFTSKINLNEVTQTNTSFEVAAFHDTELLAVSNILAIGEGSNQLFHVDLNVKGNNDFGKIYFKLFDGEKEYVSVEKIQFVDQSTEGGSHATPTVINFKSIAEVNNVVYPSFAEAYEVAQAGQTVTLLDDITSSEIIVINKTVTLDLNGKTITGTDNTSKNFGLIDNRGDLTITDSSTEKDGKITLTATVNSGWSRYSAVIANNPGGKLTVEAGTLEHLGGTDMAYGIDNLTNGKGTYAETIINGGTVKSPYRAIRQFLNGVEAQNILTVNGGTIEGVNKSIWMQDPSKNANTGTLTVGADAKLIGDVNLTVTAGSTEWPVEISIAAAALQGESTVLTSNLPVGIDVQNVNGTYSKVNVVAQIEDEYYKTLQDAIDAATEGQTVTVIANIELENTVTVAAGKVVTLDLNGNVVSGVCNSSQAHLFMVQNTAELTVKDSSENQEGKITYARGTSGTGWAIDLEGELVLESGTIELTGESWSIGYVVDIRPNSWGTEYTEATTFTMKGGKLVSSFDAIRIASTSADGSQANGVVHENVSANFVMNGGEIVSNRDAIFVQQSNAVYDILNLQVNDGKISGAQSLIRLYGPAATSVVNNVENPITLDINGGTFDYTGNNLEDTRWLVPGVIMVAGGATFDQMLDYTNFEITGGTFDGDVSAYCAFGYTCQANGDGTYGVVETEGFEIPNLDRLIAFRNAVNAGNTFKGQTVTVTADISMGDVENWTPIGTSEHAFQGTFDGGNFTISNLKIDASEASNVGLFGCINNGAIKNLTIDNATVNAKSNVGAIVGNLHSSTMDNCHVTGSVQINGNYKVGGLVGTAYSIVRNSSLVADDYSYVKGTYSTANFEGDNVGGITGYNGEGVYTYSNNTVKNVTISGTRKVGGILGFIFEDAKVEGSVVENVIIESTATDEYAQENAGKMSIGGIIGQYQTHGNNDGYVNSSVVKNVTFVKSENQDFQVGPLVGGTRNNTGFVPSETVTSKDNLVYMSTITGSNNLFLMQAVAKIEETNYYTLEEAIAAADNQTVTVLANVELRNTLTIAVDQTVTLDLNGKTISASITEQLTKSFAAIKNKGTLTVKDSGTEGKISVSYSGETFGYGVGLYTISNEGGVLNIESGIVENTATVAGSMYDAIDNNSTLGETVLNISGGEVRCAQYIGVRQFANSTTKDNIVNVTGGKVSGGNTSIWMQNPGSNQPKATIAISGNANINGRLLAGTSEGFVFAVTGGTFSTDVTDFCAQGYVCKPNADGTYGVFLGVAKIEETGVIYGTLAEAISNATAGNTITLLANVTEDVTVNKDLTINGDSKEYTGNISVKGNTVDVIVKNVKFVDGTGYAITTNTIRSITVENCTVGNYAYGFLYANKSTPTVVVKEVTVENCNYGFHWVYGTTATIEKVTMTNVSKGLYIQNYASKTINVKNSNISSIAIWERSGYSGVQTFNFEGESTVGTFSTSQYAKYVLSAEGAKLINAKEGLTVTTTVEDCIVKYEEGETAGFGTYSVIPGNVELVRGETSVGKFATIQDAIDAAQNSDVVRIVSEDTFVMDITTGVTNSDGYYTLANVASKEVVIDLNGSTVTVDVTNLPEGCKNDMLIAVFCADVNGKLTLRDSGENGSISVTGGQYKTVYSMVIAYEGLVNIESGSYSIDYMNEGRGMIYGNVGDGDGNTSNTNQGVNISGGNFTLGNVGTLANGSPWILATAGSNSGKYVYVTGGTYNADILHQHWAFEVLAPVNKALKKNGGGTYSIVDAVAFVTQHEYSGYYTETGYATLKEAFERAHTAGDIITLLQDITLAESITVEADQEVVLDLNGKNINVANDQVNFNINGKLTLEDAVGTGVFTSRNHMVNAGGEFIINAGTVQNIETLNVGFPIYINGGSVTINGGTIQAVNNDNYAIGYSANGGTLTIDGGTVKGNWGAVNMASGSATITAGTLEVTGTKGGHALYVAGDAQVTIEGGEFKPYVGSGVASYALVLDSKDATVNVSGGMFHKEWGCVYVPAGTLSLTGGTYSEDVNAYCAEGFAAVDNGDGTWTVMPSQEQLLGKGYNWYSSYLNITTDNLLSALSTVGKTVVLNGQWSATYYGEEDGWDYESHNLDFSKMYMIQTSAAHTLKLTGNLLETKTINIAIKEGWNWIGYPSNVKVEINNALKNLKATEGDRIVGQAGFADYVEMYGGWVGSLKYLEPTNGYQYYSKNDEEVTFVYNVSATSKGNNETTVENHYAVDYNKYPFNMTMVAVVEGMTNGNYEVAAFVNGEVRGSARPVYVEVMDAYMLFLTISGDEAEEVSFKLYDIDTDTEYDLSNRFNYSNNAMLGSVNEPCVLSRGTTGIGEATLSNINIYPNPTTIGTEINLQATFETVEVFNALGVKVAEYQNVDSIDALETAGIYVIRLTNNGNTQNCRLVVR